MHDSVWAYLASCVVFGVGGTLALVGLGWLALEGAWRLLAWRHRRRITP